MEDIKWKDVLIIIAYSWAYTIIFALVVGGFYKLMEYLFAKV